MYDKQIHCGSSLSATAVAMTQAEAQQIKGAAQLTPSPDRPELARALESIESAIGTLESACAAMSARLDPVLRPQADGDCGMGCSPSVPRAHVTFMVENLEARIRSQTAFLGSMLDRLAV